MKTMEKIECLIRAYKRGVISIELAMSHIIVLAGNEMIKSAEESVAAGVPVISDPWEE